MSSIESLVEQIKQSTDFHKNKLLLKERIQTDLTVPYNNGLFLITTDLLSFLATWPGDQLFLEDTFNNPVSINREEFLTLARQRYQSVMNDWHQQHNELKRIRKI